MANWKNKLIVSDFWEDDFDPKRHSRKIVSAIKTQLPEYVDELQGIIDDFELLDEYSTVDDFDYVLADLYDWGDQEVRPFGKWPRNAMCWIETWAPPQDKRPVPLRD